MNQPKPTLLLHFTRVEHLETIFKHGLYSDTRVKPLNLLSVEVGNSAIKERRANQRITTGPEGVVADYVPFYFAPRSPMMYSIHAGNVPNYREGCSKLVYLITSLEKLRELGCSIILSDRNAVLKVAAFQDCTSDDPPSDFIDWGLMKERYWANTEEQPDRKERRMAECLVHDVVPPEGILGIATQNREVAMNAERTLVQAGRSLEVRVMGDWYF